MEMSLIITVLVVIAILLELFAIALGIWSLMSNKQFEYKEKYMQYMKRKWEK